MSTIKQTTIKELVLRIHPEALKDMLLNTDGAHFPFEFQNDEAVAYAIVPNDDGTAVDVYNVIGIHNGKVLAIGCGIFSDDAQEPSRWTDLNDEDTVVYIHPYIPAESDIVPYMAFYEPVEPNFRTTLPLIAPDGEVRHTLVTFWETTVGAEVAHGALEDGSYGVVHLQDTLTNRKFSYVVFMDEPTTSAWESLEQDPSTLMAKLPECLVLLGLAKVHKLTTYASETIGFAEDGSIKEPVVSTGHAFSIAEQLMEEPQTDSESSLHGEDSEDDALEDEFAEILAKSKEK